MSGLHLPTLLVACSVLSALLALLCLSAVRAMPAARDSLRGWAWGLLCLACATPLFGLRAELPEAVGLLVPNALTLICGGTMVNAFALALNQPARRGLEPALLLFGCAGVLAYLSGMAPASAAATVPLSMAIAFLLIAKMLLAPGARQEPAAMAALIVYLVASLLWGGRALLALAGGERVVLRMELPTPLQIGAFLSGVAVVVTGTLGLFGLLHAQQRRRLEEGAARDNLTGLLNRGAFFERAAAQLAASAGPHALLMIDIDHFKRVNDQYGHQVGDLVLAHAARRLSASVRLQDLAGRYGGEEFCVLLKDCDAGQAQAFAQRLVDQAAADSISLRDGRSLGYTLSVGHALGSADLQDLIAAADAALYRAKTAGRNRALGARPLPA